MARRVRFLAGQVEKEKETIKIRPLRDSPPLIAVGPRGPQTIDELDVKLAEHEVRLKQMNESYQILSDRLRELVEARHVLRETAVFFDGVRLTLFRKSSLLTDWDRSLRGAKPRFETLSTRVQHLCSNTMIVKIAIQLRAFSLTSSESFYLDCYCKV